MASSSPKLDRFFHGLEAPADSVLAALEDEAVLEDVPGDELVPRRIVRRERVAFAGGPQHGWSLSRLGPLEEIRGPLAFQWQDVRHSNLGFPPAPALAGVRFNVTGQTIMSPLIHASDQPSPTTRPTHPDGETHRHTRPMDLRVYQPASPPSWVAHLGSTLAIPYSPPTRANARTSPLRRTALVVATTSGYLHARPNTKLDEGIFR